MEIETLNPPQDILDQFDIHEQRLLCNLGLEVDIEKCRCQFINVQTGTIFASFPVEWLDDSEVDIFAWLQERVKTRYVSSRDLLMAAQDGEI